MTISSYSSSNILPVAARQELERFLDALRRFLQAVPAGVLAEPF
jgi:hypothetical protein